MKWEYQSFGLWWHKWQEAIDFLNAKGDDGWEAVTIEAQKSHRTNNVTDMREARLWGIFKRPAAMDLTGDID